MLIVRLVIAILIGSIIFFAASMVVHGWLLMPAYAETADQWRPMAEMQPVVIQLGNVALAASLVFSYAVFVRPKGWLVGLGFGVLTGWGVGLSASLVTWGTMDLPAIIPVLWCAEKIVVMGLVGLVAGLLMPGPTPLAATSPVRTPPADKPMS